MTDSERIEALIDQLMQDTRRASYGKFNDISAELETVLIDLHALDRESLARIRWKAERCAACLTAAAQGLRAGQRRLAELAAAERSDTYDRSGARQALPMHNGGRRL